MAGAVLVPGAQGISEWQSPIQGFIQTCVQAAEAVITGVYGVLPTTPQTTTRLAQDQIARGEAGAHGASNWQSASDQLRRLGIANTSYGPSYVRTHNWTPLVNQALAQGKPVLFGVPDAYALKDAYTGAQPDLGVFGHGLTFVGYQNGVYTVADPNTAPGSGFLHYTADNLQSAGIDSLVIPNTAPGAVQAGYAGTGIASLPAPTIGGGASGSGGGGWNPIAIGQAAGTAAAGTIWDHITSGLGSWAQDAGIRVALFALAAILIVIGLAAFFFAGSGRPAVVEGAKAGAKAAVTAVAA